ncbi:MAG: histidine phosphatase family protein [Burkholderiaceae bacterium]
MTNGLPPGPGWRLVRHARVLTPEGLCYGRLDVADDPAHTEASAHAIAAAWPAPRAVRCSPLGRCLALARSLAEQWPGLRIDVDERLAEMHFGQWEGRLWRDVPRTEIEQWRAAFADHRVGGDGESVRAFMARVARARDDALARRDGDEGDGGAPAATWWITHAGVIRAMQLLERGIACPADGRDWPRADLAFGVCHSL